MELKGEEQMAAGEHSMALNLAKILYKLLQTPKGWAIDELTQSLQIQPRTYRKYRKVLKDNFDYLVGANNRGSIEEVFEGERRYLRVVEQSESIDMKEDILSRMASLYLAKSLFRFLSQTKLNEALETIYTELQTRIGDKDFYLNHFFQNMDKMLYYIPDAPKDYRGQSERIAKLLSAIFYRRRIEFAYTSGEGKTLTHDVEPLTLMLYKNGLYLVAQYTKNKRRYTFALDRIEHIDRKKERFAYPKDYSPAAYTEGCFGIYRGHKKRKIRFELIFDNDRRLKTYLKERQWHPSQRFKKMRDGRLRMLFSVRSDVEVWPWIRSFGRQVEVVLPKKRPEDFD